MNMKKEALAAMMASMADVDLMTCDRIEALTKGHGMLTMAVYSVANVIADEVQRGVRLRVSSANVAETPLDDVLKKCITAAKDAGADAANAALLSATLLYFAGSNAQAGVATGNRKLGAMARMIAGADRCGVAAVSTPKLNNKISGFPAVQAIHRAMEEGALCPIDGRNVPNGVARGPLYGHSALVEDIVYPALAKEGARIGAAAILEIVHPDARGVAPEWRCWASTSDVTPKSKRGELSASS